MDRIRRRSLLTLPAFACLMLVGTSLSAVAQGSGDRVLRLVQETEVQSLNQNVQSTRGAMRITNEIMETAIRATVQDGKLVLQPLLATEWNQVDETTWRFKIREGVKFTNGEPLTAEAFVKTQEFLKSYPVGASNSVFAYISEMTALDDHTLQIKTSLPNLSSLPAQMSYFVVYPPAYRATLGMGQEGEVAFGNAPVGTGPYMLDEWQRGVSLKLKANPDYWGEQPDIKALDLRMVSDPATRVSMLQSGAVDIAAEVPPQLYSRVQAIAGTHLNTVPSDVRIFLGLNLNEAPTNNKLVRQAINYAINREGLIKGLLRGAGAPINGILVPGELGYNPDFKGYPYDPDMAKKLLAESGLTLPIPLTLNYTIGLWDADRQLAEAIQQQLTDVGFDITMLGGPNSTITPPWRKPGESKGIYQFQFSPVYPDTNFQVSAVYFGPKAAFAAWGSDPTLTAMADKAAAAPAAERDALYRAYEEYAMNEVVGWAPLYVRQLGFGVSDKIEWTPPSNNRLYLPTMKWKD
jgi:peptide/nickel transport system substrate-binding protein